MRRPLAIVTMVYDEPDFLPIWCRYYAGEVGAEHCYVVDHGSDDGSTAALGAVNRLGLPRSPQDDGRRARFLSGLCAALLEYYEAVLHVDVDEIVLPAPGVQGGLGDAVAAERRPVATAIGLDLVHLPAHEPAFAPDRPVSLQRRWLRFASSMCKPALIRQPVAWAPGFHCIDAAPDFAPLCLVHLRYMDRDLGLRRLRRTRAQPWADPAAAPHQRGRDDDWLALIDAIAALPRRDAAVLDPCGPPLSLWLDRVRDSARGRERELYRVDLHLAGDELWPMPATWRGRF